MKLVGISKLNEKNKIIKCNIWFANLKRKKQNN